MSGYDEELIDRLRELKIHVIEYGANNTEMYFDLLNARFPVTGTKIDWDSIFSKCKKTAKYTIPTDFSDFIQEIKKDCPQWGNEDEDIIYIGDSLTERAYNISFAQLVDFFKLINEIPQHHYFLNKNADWCLSLDMSNDIDFSFAPNLS
jgi:hypothetical protein